MALFCCILLCWSSDSSLDFSIILDTRSLLTPVSTLDLLRTAYLSYLSPSTLASILDLRIDSLAFSLWDLISASTLDL